jgi:hypothetical protein
MTSVILSNLYNIYGCGLWSYYFNKTKNQEPTLVTVFISPGMDIVTVIL